jgi:hypothetical protein
MLRLGQYTYSAIEDRSVGISAIATSGKALGEME